MSLKARLPKLAAGAAILGVLLSFHKPAQPDYDFNGFGRLPALEGGRIKPLDTVARTSLLMLRGKQTLRLDGRTMSASEWLLDLMARPEAADAYKVFVIDDPDILGLLGKEQGSEKYFAAWELSPLASDIAGRARKASQLDASQRSRFETAIVNLHERMELYARLKNTLQADGTRDMTAELAAFAEALPAGLKALQGHVKAGSGAFDQKALARLNGFFERYKMMAEAAFFRPIPPAAGERAEEWTSVGDSLLQAMRGAPPSPGVDAYARMLSAYRRRDAAGFNAALASCRISLQSQAPKALAAAAREETFNWTQPFYQGMILYLCAALLVFVSWLAWPEALRKTAFSVLAVAVAVHTAGLAARILLQGRPPVTNLYSSAVFVGWVAALLGLLLERRFRDGFAALASASIGFSTLIIAQHLTTQGDTMEMMRAVLDSNFWLATHVVTITIGYAATFLAAFFAHIYIVRGFIDGGVDPKAGKSLTSMTYGVVCFALFFSFVGTVLGGIWADQSWGRFWGWDPKENGALLIVLWNAIILHARWGGFIRERGLMLMAVFGAVITSLSWFGVNMLGVGLHSYGFMDKALYALAAFIAVELSVMALGALPWPSRCDDVPRDAHGQKA